MTTEKIANSDQLQPVEVKDVPMTLTCRSCSKQFTAMFTSFNGRPWMVCHYCHPCSELQRAKAKEEEKVKQARQREELIRKNVPKLFLTTDLVRLSPSALKATLAWCAEAPSTQGLILIGPTNGGKTRLLWEAYKALVRRGVTVRVHTETDLRNLLLKSGTLEAREELRRRLKRVAVLALDDLGKTKLTEAAEELIFDLVDYRYTRELPLIVTTQHGGDKLAQRFADVANGAAFARRLRDTCRIVTVDVTPC